MEQSRALSAISTLLPVAALAIYLAEPSGAHAGSGCWYQSSLYSEYSCVDNCWLPWDKQQCRNGTWLSCGSC